MSTYNRDFPTELGPLGLCLRLKRLAERMNQDARRLYAELGLEIEPGWHSVLLQLEEEPAGLGVSQIARNLGITHPSASVVVRQLLNCGYVEDSSDPEDGRRRIVRLSARGKEVLPHFKEVWAAFRTSMQGVVDATNQDVFGTVAALEAELKRRPMDERVMDVLPADTTAGPRPS